MKLILSAKRSIRLTYLAVFIMLYAACSSDNNGKSKMMIAQTPAKPMLTEPFRYHKLIEVSPGNDFDIFSWGRGATETGSLLILNSDTAAKKFTTTTGDLEGAITDVYNTDMDMDGNPEILVQAKAKDTTVHTQIYAFEYRDNKAQKLDFPKLTSSQRKGYRGEDNFYIKEGILMREFPVYDGNGSDAKPTGQKRLLQYGLRNNSFTVKIISAEENETSKINTKTDSVKEAISPPANKPAPKKVSQKKHAESGHSSVKKKSGKKTTKHKKHHRR